jgi:hypothetical protein
MKEAVKKDTQSLDRHLREICKGSLPVLGDLKILLRERLKVGSTSSGLRDEDHLYSKLQAAIDEVYNKTAACLLTDATELLLGIPMQHLQEMGYIGARSLLFIPPALMLFVT